MERDARWIAEERKLWDAMMAPRHVHSCVRAKRGRLWRVIAPGCEYCLDSRDNAEATALADGWRAYSNWVRH